MIPYGRQDIDQSDVDAVVDVLRSDFLTQGPKVPIFEKVVANKVGALHAVAVNSATSALHIACKALGLGPGDHIWTSPITFVASANCGLYCGARVDFIIIDPSTFNMCPKKLEQKLIIAKERGTLPKIVVPIDLCGQSADLIAIRSLADTYGFLILEDASHAIGGQYNEKYIGCGEYADITVFSFHPVKIITTAEGGVAVTNDETLAQKMELFRSHGVTRNPELMVNESHGPWYYEQVELGFNYRMTELQAALGISQMARLDRFVENRTRLAENYFNLLSDLPLMLPLQDPQTASSWHLFVVQLENNQHHKQVFEQLRASGIGVNLHYIPVHLQPFYKHLGFKTGDFPMAEDYYSRSISIPLYAGMSDQDQMRVVEKLTETLI